MAKYLKLFETTSEYETYISGEDVLLPNVSYCEDNNGISYNPWVDSKLVCKYNVTSISSPTQLRVNYEPNIFQSMEIDGVQLDNLVTEYTFDSTGVHTVKYELYDETKLGNNAPVFYNITSLISVSIPNSVTSIGTAAFQSCSGLTSITIPNNVTSISSGAFAGCSGLKRLTIPSGVTSIGSGAFASCSGLVTITVDSNNSTYDSRNDCNAIIETATNALIAACKNTVIPNNVTSIGINAFNGCTRLTNVTIPNGVTSIGTGAFYDCSGLTSITIPNNVTSIGINAFNGCTRLTNITIPSSVTSIGERAFGGCTSLANITVDNNNSTYDSRNNCNAIINTNTNTLVAGCKNTVIPNTVTSIDDSAFQQHTTLTGTLTIPNSVTSIGAQSFYNCSGLTSVTIGSGVTSIANFAFQGCSGLTSITIPNGVLSIGSSAFNNCSNITSVTVEATTPPTLGGSAFSNNASGRKIYVPSASVETYKATSGWSSYASAIQAIPTT